MNWNYVAKTEYESEEYVCGPYKITFYEGMYHLSYKNQNGYHISLAAFFILQEAKDAAQKIHNTTLNSNESHD